MGGKLESQLSFQVSNTSEGLYMCQIAGVWSKQIRVQFLRAPRVILPERIFVEGHSAEVKFTVIFMGDLKIQLIRLSDMEELAYFAMTINGTESVSILVGNITYGENHCFSVLILSSFPTTTHPTCLRRKELPLQPSNVHAKRAGSNMVHVWWSLPSADVASTEEHEAARKFIVYAEAGNWSAVPLTVDQNKTEVTITEVPSCTPIKVWVAAKGKSLLSKKTLATIISTDMYMKNTMDIRLQCHNNTLTINKNLLVKFGIISVNRTDNQSICDTLLRDATHPLPKHGCWKTNVDDSLISYMLAQVLVDCPLLVDCEEKYIMRMCNDVYEYLCPGVGSAVQTEDEFEDSDLFVGLVAGLPIGVIVIIATLIFIYCKYCKATTRPVSMHNGSIKGNTNGHDVRPQPEGVSPEPIPDDCHLVGDDCHGPPNPRGIDMSQDNNGARFQHSNGSVNSSASHVVQHDSYSATAVIHYGEHKEDLESLHSVQTRREQGADTVASKLGDDGSAGTRTQRLGTGRLAGTSVSRPGGSGRLGSSRSGRLDSSRSAATMPGDCEDHSSCKGNPACEQPIEMELFSAVVADPSRLAGDIKENTDNNNGALQELKAQLKRVEERQLDAQKIQLEMQDEVSERLQKIRDNQEEQLILQHQGNNMITDIAANQPENKERYKTSTKHGSSVTQV
jgi:hypothetical protein